MRCLDIQALDRERAVTILVTCCLDGDRVLIEGDDEHIIQDLKERGIPIFREDESWFFAKPADGEVFFNALPCHFRGSLAWTGPEYER